MATGGGERESEKKFYFGKEKGAGKVALKREKSLSVSAIRWRRRRVEEERDVEVRWSREQVVSSKAEGQQTKKKGSIGCRLRRD